MSHRLSQRDKHNRDRRLPPHEEPEFQIAPMIDILLVLLIFFMSLTSTEIMQAVRDLTLPVAKDARSASKSNPGQIIINIRWIPINNTGELEVDNLRYPEPAALVPKLQKAIMANPLVRVLIRADKSVRYEYLRSVMKAVGDAGVRNVTFAVVDKERANSTAP